MVLQVPPGCGNGNKVRGYRCGAGEGIGGKRQITEGAGLGQLEACPAGDAGNLADYRWVRLQSRVHSLPATLRSLECTDSHGFHNESTRSPSSTTHSRVSEPQAALFPVSVACPRLTCRVRTQLPWPQQAMALVLAHLWL